MGKRLAVGKCASRSRHFPRRRRHHFVHLRNHRTAKGSSFHSPRHHFSAHGLLFACRGRQPSRRNKTRSECVANELYSHRSAIPCHWLYPSHDELLGGGFETGHHVQVGCRESSRAHFAREGNELRWCSHAKLGPRQPPTF